MNKYLITSALLLVFGTSAYMSIYGLAAVFAGAGMVAVLMGAGMELGKLLTVIHLHRQWRGMRFCMRGFYMLVITALVMITSFEILGYLSQSHVQATRDLTLGRTALTALEHEEQLLTGSIETIDITLAGLPETYVTKRIKERQAAGYDRMQARLVEIAKERSDLEKECITNRAYAAPIFAAAGIFGIDATRAASIFILVLVMVLEPLSIGLAVAASSAWTCKNEHRTSNVQHRMLNETHASPKGYAGQGAGRAVKICEKGPVSNWPPEKAAKTSGKSGGQNEAAGIDNAQELQPDTETARNVRTLNDELRLICRHYKLAAHDAAKICNKRKAKTVKMWLNDDIEIPIKALRLLRRWAKNQPKVRLVKKTQITQRGTYDA